MRNLFRHSSTWRLRVYAVENDTNKLVYESLFKSMGAAVDEGRTRAEEARHLAITDVRAYFVVADTRTEEVYTFTGNLLDSVPEPG